MTESRDSVTSGGPPVTAGPTVSFGFNLGKIPGQGEDSDPIVRDGPDLGLVGVFDGMGGAGGTVYETADGPRTGAYLASRIARDVAERRMLDLLEPDWNLNGEATARDLHRSIREALQERLEELKAPKSGLRSRLLRALPTTMALIGLQRTRRNGSTWACHVFWSGDSRAYVLDADGARQLSTDDLRDTGDAMANLRGDSVVSNAMSADTEFEVNYRRVELRAPFVLLCATDGCFGYLPTPMHFEHLVLAPLLGARNAQAWSEGIQAEVAAVTGDDAAMATMAVGADLDDLQTLFAPRVAQLQREFITPIDELNEAVAAAERELALVRQRQVERTAEIWKHYKADYERHLHPQSAPGPSGPLGADPDASGADPATPDTENGEPVTPAGAAAMSDGETLASGAAPDVDAGPASQSAWSPAGEEDVQPGVADDEEVQS